MPDGDAMALTLFCLLGCVVVIRLAVPMAVPDVEPLRWPCGCRHGEHETWQGSHFHRLIDKA